MRTEEEIHGQFLQHVEAPDVVLGDLRIFFVAHENEAGVHVGTADDHGVEGSCAVGDPHRPGRATRGVSGRETGGQRGAAEFDGVAVVEHAVDFRGGAAGRGAFDRGDIGRHHHQTGAGFLFNEADRRVVVAVGVADEQNLRVGVSEAELRDALAQQRQILRIVGVDQDVSLRRVDQVDREIGGADVVEIAGNFYRRKLDVPVVARRGGQIRDRNDRQE